jgi:hypothetical protein
MLGINIGKLRGALLLLFAVQSAGTPIEASMLKLFLTTFGFGSTNVVGIQRPAVALTQAARLVTVLRAP